MTYAEIVAIITDTIQSNDEPTFAVHIPDFVRMAEETIMKEVQLPVMTKTVRGSCTAANEYITLPSDYIAPLYVCVLSSDVYSILVQKDSSFLLQAFPSRASVDQAIPTYYSPDDEGKLRVRPIPDQNYTFELEYSHKPTSIVDVTAGVETWISVNMKTALVYGALIHAALYIFDDKVAAAYKAMFDDALGKTKIEQEGKARTDRWRSDYKRPQVRENQ